MVRLAALFLVVLFSAGITYADVRHSSVRRAFLKAHGLTKTPKGCQVDHVVSLHLGGRDTVKNLCLICGAKLREKEYAERKKKTLVPWLMKNQEWLKEHRCAYEWPNPKLLDVR